MPFADFKKIKSHVLDRLSNKAIGYQLAAIDQARPGSDGEMEDTFGSAVRKLDPILAKPEYLGKLTTGVKMTSQRRMDIDSMSKTITAAGVVKLISDGLLPSGLDSPLAAFLPSHWTFGPRVDSLTLRHVLRHNSKLTEFNKYGIPLLRIPTLGGQGIDPAYYRSIKATIEVGIPDDTWNDPADPDFLYQNVNYALFRIAIPYMRRKVFFEQLFKDLTAQPHKGQFAPNPSAMLDLSLSSDYVTFIRDDVLSPCGIANADVRPTDTPPTRSYDLEKPELPVSELASDLFVSGSTGWNLSAKDFCRFIVGLADGAFCPRWWWSIMRVQEIGMGRIKGKHGTYYFHSGAFPNRNSAWVWAPGIDKYQTGLVMAIMINTTRKDDDDLENPQHVLRDAYDASL